MQDIKGTVFNHLVFGDKREGLSQNFMVRTADGKEYIGISLRDGNFNPLIVKNGSIVYGKIQEHDVLITAGEDPESHKVFKVTAIRPGLMGWFFIALVIVIVLLVIGTILSFL